MRVVARVLEKPLSGRRALIGSLMGAAFTALCSQIAFYIPGNPVPVNMGVFAVVCCALFLGGRYAALAQLEFLAAGLLGAPVFAGFRAGVIALVGWTGGYLIGYVVAAFVAGTLFERSSRGFTAACAAGAVAVSLIYTLGVGFLATFHGSMFPGMAAWLVGAAPFVGIDAVKVVAASLIATRGGIHREG